MYAEHVRYAMLCKTRVTMTHKTRHFVLLFARPISFVAHSAARSLRGHAGRAAAGRGTPRGARRRRRRRRRGALPSFQALRRVSSAHAHACRMPNADACPACAQGDEAPSLDAALPAPAFAAESALEALAALAARLLLTGAPPEPPFAARDTTLLSLAASPCGQARPSRGRGAGGANPMRRLCALLTLYRLTNATGGCAGVRRRAAALLRGGRLPLARGGAASAAPLWRRLRKRRALLATPAPRLVAARAPGRPAGAGARGCGRRARP
jgi:hypothetical protein